MTDALPTIVQVTSAFNTRLPSQRFMDQLAKIDATPFPELASSQPFRLVAYRALLRDYPDRDPTSLWFHAYDCEVEVTEEDPFAGNGARTSPPSAATGIASPAT